MAVIKKEIRDALVKQAVENMSTAETHKLSKMSSWHKNEDLYYGKKQKTDGARANVDLGQMQEHVHTILSKIDSPLTFKFLKMKEAQDRRVSRANAVRDYDADRDFWDMKDIVGKKQMVIYGRAMYAYSASSVDGYTPNLENVDVYDFLIDPDAGGIDIDRARFLGRYGVIKDRSELQKDKSYIKSEVKTLLDGAGNSDEHSRQEMNKRNRESITGSRTITDSNDPDKFVFWEWYETYNGVRYYMLMTKDGNAIKVEKLSDMFDSDMWPMWTFAAYPDLTEFWTPSPSDYVREIIMAQAVSINQMIDNAERVNKPQRAIDVGAIQNLAELKYRRDGYIKMLPGSNANNAIKLLEVPSIVTPIRVFETLETIKSAASGVTAGAKGVEDTTGRATIYEGNQANVADRFALFNKSYAFGYKRFARLWLNGLNEHLNKKIAVEILGTEGIEVQMISRRDVFKKNEDFGIMTEESNADMRMSENKKRGQAAFYSTLLGRPDLGNQKVVVEQLGIVNDIPKDVLRQLQDLDDFGNSTIVSEAERDIEDILEGKNKEPNRMANTAYKQRLVDYTLDHGEDMSYEQNARMLQYIGTLDAVVMSNTIREAREQARKEQAQEGTGGSQKLRQPGPSQPLQDVIQQNVQGL